MKKTEEAPCALNYPGCQKVVERAPWLVRQFRQGKKTFSCSACKAEKARILQRERYYAKAYESDLEP